MNDEERVFRLVSGPVHSKKWDIRFSHAVHQLRSRNGYEKRACLLGAHISLAGGRVMVVATVCGPLKCFRVFALTELNMSLCPSSISITFWVISFFTLEK